MISQLLNGLLLLQLLSHYLVLLLEVAEAELLYHFALNRRHSSAGHFWQADFGDNRLVGLPETILIDFGQEVVGLEHLYEVLELRNLFNQGLHIEICKKALDTVLIVGDSFFDTHAKTLEVL